MHSFFFYFEQWFELLVSINHLLVVSNSSFNFLIYLWASKRNSEQGKCKAQGQFTCVQSMQFICNIGQFICNLFLENISGISMKRIHVYHRNTHRIHDLYHWNIDKPRIISIKYILSQSLCLPKSGFLREVQQTFAKQISLRALQVIMHRILDFYFYQKQTMQQGQSCFVMFDSFNFHRKHQVDHKLLTLKIICYFL